MAVIFVEYDRDASGAPDNAFNTLRSYLAAIKGCYITYLRVNNKNEGRGLNHRANLF